MNRQKTIVSPMLLTELVRRFGRKAVTDIHPVISKDKVTGFSVSVPGFFDMEQIRQGFKEKRLLQRIEAGENFLKLQEETSKFPLDTLLYVFSGMDVGRVQRLQKETSEFPLDTLLYVYAGKKVKIPAIETPRRNPLNKIRKEIPSVPDYWEFRIIEVFGCLQWERNTGDWNNKKEEKK